MTENRMPQNPLIIRYLGQDGRFDTVPVDQAVSDIGRLHRDKNSGSMLVSCRPLVYHPRQSAISPNRGE